MQIRILALSVLRNFWHLVDKFTRQKYNVGFVNLTKEELIAHSKKSKTLRLKNILWIKNPSKRTWYADPFIYKVTDNEIEVFVEEQIERKPGRLVSLQIDRKTGDILKSRVLLELDTHLSYPQIIECNGKTYVIPENMDGGSISIYTLSPNGILVKEKKLIEGQYADSTVYYHEDDKTWYMVVTDNHWYSYLYKSKSLYESWSRVNMYPIIRERTNSRCGGSFFKVRNKIFRTAQDCKDSYGNSLHIMQIESFEPYAEKEVLHIKPQKNRYNLGIHTLNFHEGGVAVLDGKGYNYSVVGRAFSCIVCRIYDLLYRNISKWHKVLKTSNV